MGLLTKKRGPKRSPLPKIYHTYPAMMKLDTVIPYLRKIQKNHLNHVIHSLISADITIFSQEIANLAISRNTDID